MKTLLLLRHAKSSWKDPSLADHDRPLNKRGRRDAPRMGRLIEELGIIPDVVVCSTAERAQSTAILVAGNCGLTGEILFDSRLYHASPAEHVSVLADVAGGPDSVMAVGHNPGLEGLLAVLTGDFEPLPTAALARLSLAVEKWDELSLETPAQLDGLWRPRELDDAG